jgi:hypothetical protein
MVPDFTLHTFCLLHANYMRQFEDGGGQGIHMAVDETGISVRDGVIAGDASVTSSGSGVAQINVQDSAIAGDVTIVQNTMNTDELVEKLRSELTQFKSGGVGFKLPEGGFSRHDIEALIPQLIRDPSPLRELSTPNLVEFGRLLRAMAQPKLLAIIASQLLGREDVRSTPAILTAAHLLGADAETAVLRPRSALQHADTAFQIANEHGLIELAACALHTSIRCCKELSIDRMKYVENVTTYLEQYGESNDIAAAWLHISLGEHHEGARGGLADHHESMGLDRARKAGDIEAQILALVLSADNTHWVIREHIWEDLKSSSERYGLRFYSMLINLADFVRHGEYQRLLAGIRTIQRTSREAGLIELEVMGALLQFTQGVHNIIEDGALTQAQKSSSIRQLLDEDHIAEAIDRVLTEGYLGLDDELVFFFGLIALSNLSLPPQGQAYLQLERESTTVSIRAMLLLLSGITENGTYDQRVLRNVKKMLIEKEITLDQPVWRLFELASKSRRTEVITPQQREQFVQRNPVPADIGRFVFWFVATFWLIELMNLLDYIDFSFAEYIALDESFTGLFLPIVFIASYTMRSLRASKITELRRSQQNRPDPIPYLFNETTISEGREIVNILLHWLGSLLMTLIFFIMLVGESYPSREGVIILFVLYVLITQSIHNSHHSLQMWRRFAFLNVCFVGVAFFMDQDIVHPDSFLTYWYGLMVLVLLVYFSNKKTMQEKYSAMIQQYQDVN